jgi:hypothetical protein
VAQGVGPELKPSTGGKKDSTLPQSDWQSSGKQQILVRFKGVETDRILIQCWLECKFIHPQWKSVSRFLKKLKLGGDSKRVARGRKQKASLL